MSAAPVQTQAARVRSLLRSPSGGEVTTEAFALLVGVSLPTATSWEKGKSVPDRDHTELLTLLERLLSKQLPSLVWTALVETSGSKARMFARLAELDALPTEKLNNHEQE